MRRNNNGGQNIQTPICKEYITVTSHGHLFTGRYITTSHEISYRQNTCNIIGIIFNSASSQQDEFKFDLYLPVSSLATFPRKQFVGLYAHYQLHHYAHQICWTMFISRIHLLLTRTHLQYMEILTIHQAVRKNVTHLTCLPIWATTLCCTRACNDIFSLRIFCNTADSRYMWSNKTILHNNITLTNEEYRKF